MPPRAPGKHPAEGETLQEHELDHRRDQLAEDQGIWRDWDSHNTEFLTRAQLLKNLHDAYGIDVDANQIEQWEAQGFLPPGPRSYAPSDGFLIRTLLKAEAAGLDPDTIRIIARINAETLDEDNALDARDKLAELTDEARRNQQSWADWMPEGAPAPTRLFSRDELLLALKEQNVELNPATFNYYRQRGALPRPIRRRYSGATQAVYPDWMVDAVVYLRKLQDQGISLEEIGPHLRAWVQDRVSS